MERTDDYIAKGDSDKNRAPYRRRGTGPPWAVRESLSLHSPGQWCLLVYDMSCWTPESQSLGLW